MCSLDGHTVVEHAVIFTDDDTNPRAELQGLDLDAASLGKVYFDNNSASKKILSGGNLICHGNNFCYPADVTNITFEDWTA